LQNILTPAKKTDAVAAIDDAPTKPRKVASGSSDDI